MTESYPRTQLLERDCNKRIGCKNSGGLAALKAHPWMRKLDWSLIESKKAQPLFEPDSKKANFDATHELEELLLEDNPLKAKKRDPKKADLSAMSSEMRLMEESFRECLARCLRCLDPLTDHTCNTAVVYDHTAMERKSWFPDPHGQTTSSMTMASKVLSIEDQPLASRAATPATNVPAHGGELRQSYTSSRPGTTVRSNTAGSEGPVMKEGQAIEMDEQRGHRNGTPAQSPAGENERSALPRHLS